jgi:DNA-binding response OmpR family regulator
LLQDQGWRVETCADGSTALVKIFANVHYDLPNVNGLELVHRARKLAHRSHTPVVVFSASPVEAACPRSRCRCVFAEAAGYWIAR